MHGQCSAKNDASHADKSFIYSLKQVQLAVTVRDCDVHMYLQACVCAASVSQGIVHISTRSRRLRQRRMKSMMGKRTEVGWSCQPQMW